MKPLEVIFTAYNLHGDRISGDVTFEDTNPEFKNITIRSVESDPRKEEFHIIVKKTLQIGGSAEIKAIVNEALDEAEKFVCVFSVFSGIKLYGFTFLGYQTDGSLREPKDLFGSNDVSSSAFATVTKSVGAPWLIELKERMSSEYNISKLLLYHTSATLTDPIARFLSLYMVMLHDVGDTQWAVDEAILGLDATVGQFKKPDGKRFETVFTKLRNEVGHKREGVNILETHRLIHDNVDRFEEIVKKHILR